MQLLKEMKIDKIIFSCDGAYYPFWEPISEVVSKVLKVKPVLFFINDHEETDFYESNYGLVKKIKTIDGISSALLGQIYRLYGTKFFQNEVCLISDIDMILFNNKWLENHLTPIINEDSLVLLNSDAYDSSRPECLNSKTRFPMCYLVGKGKIFNKIVNLDRSFEDFAKEIHSINAGFDSDEIFFSSKFIEHKDEIEYHLIKRGYSSTYFAPGRIEKHMFYNTDIKDQITLMYKLNIMGKINYDSFIDCHIPRGYSSILEKIKNEILEYYS